MRARGVQTLKATHGGVAGAGKSFATHFLTDLARRLLGPDGAATVYAPTGVAAFQVGGSMGRSLLQLPTGKKAYGRLDPLKGDPLRKAQGDLSRCALLIGDERWMIGQPMLGWQEYNAAIAPISSDPNLVGS